MPPPPPPLPKTSLSGAKPPTTGVLKLSVSKEKDRVLFGGRDIANLKTSKGAAFKPSDSSQKQELAFLTLLNKMRKRWDTEFSKRKIVSNTEKFFTGFLNTAIHKPRDRQNLLIALKFSVKLRDLNESQLIRDIMFHEFDTKRVGHTYHYYDWRVVKNASPTSTHLTIPLNQEGKGLNKVIRDIAKLFSFVGNRPVRDYVRKLRRVILRPLEFDASLGGQATEDFDEMVARFYEGRRAIVMEIIRRCLAAHNETLKIFKVGPLVTMDAFFKDMKTTPTTFDIRHIERIRFKLYGMSLPVLTNIVKRRSLETNAATMEKIRSLHQTLEGGLKELSSEDRKIDTTDQAVKAFRTRLGEISNALFRPSVKSHSHFESIGRGNSNIGIKHETIRGILESLKDEIQVLVASLKTAAKEPEKAVPEAVKDAIVGKVAEKLAPEHPDLTALLRRVEKAEKAAAALARLEAKIQTLMAGKNNAVSSTLTVVARTEKAIARKDVVIKEMGMELRALKRQLRVFTGVTMAGAAAALWSYAGGRTAGQGGNRINVNAFMNQARGYNKAFTNQRKALKSNQAGTHRSIGKNKVHNRSRSIVSGLPPVAGLPSATATANKTRLLPPPASASGYGRLPLAAAGLLGGAYIAKRLSKKKKVVTGNGITELSRMKPQKMYYFPKGHPEYYEPDKPIMRPHTMRSTYNSQPKTLYQRPIFFPDR